MRFEPKYKGNKPLPSLGQDLECMWWTCAAFHHIDGEGNNIADYFAKQCTDKNTEFLAML
jgi:hypothetical protein